MPQEAYHPPPAFWDNLSKVWLTKQALIELDRRNSQARPSPSHSPHQRTRRPATRDLVAKQTATGFQAADNTDYLSRCRPKSHLKAIGSLARHGGPDLSDLRNYPEPTCRSVSPIQSAQNQLRGSATIPSTKPTTNTTKVKNTGAYDRNFHQHLVDHRIYPDEYEHPDGSVSVGPKNLEELQRILIQPRLSLSLSQFSDRDFKDFKRADNYTAKEEQLPRISTMVRGQIIPSTQHDLPIAPNFFLEVKGPDGTAAVAKRQACYDGPLGARGMHSLRFCGRNKEAYQNALAITSTYCHGTLKMYTTHLAAPSSAGRRPEYYMTQLRSFAMTDTPETCAAGYRAYRNAQD
ncbi:hypothetical protein GQ44DRAFT_816071 [Phaeosphaeriaceae sp. PMI808]|nr:hypothetical protein GQ44DRAFT_816071 [Phaeosphaeriaceae sp. PMI808]